MEYSSTDFTDFWDLPLPLPVVVLAPGRKSYCCNAATHIEGTKDETHRHDEATSALDTRSESLIQQTLENELGEATGLFIAHRLATVKRGHRSLVILGGRIVQDGTFAEPAAQPGLFRQMVENLVRATGLPGPVIPRR